jgi:hypothetical protein
LVAVIAVSIAPDVRAQVSSAESPRSGMFRLNLGGFNPRASIDSEPGLTSDPYLETFGRSGMLLFELAYERYIFQRFGAAGFGISVGYAEKYGRAIVVESPDSESSEKTALQLLPLQLYALYNWDYAAQTWHVPLVPYVHIGLSYVPWRSTKSGNVEVVDGRRAEGGKWGVGGAVGMAFLLDVLEPRLARDFDSDIGVNHTYLFGEYDLLRTNVFGGGGMNFSTRYWMFGIAFEF